MKTLKKVKTNETPPSDAVDVTEIELQYGSAVFALPGAVLSRLDEAKETELRVILLLCGEERLRRALDTAAIANRLSVGEAEVTAAISFWRGCGVLRTHKVKKSAAKLPSASEAVGQVRGEDRPSVVLHSDGRPHYTGKELSELLERRADLQSLLAECQKISGKLFTQTDCLKLLTLADSYSLSSPYLMLLFQHCKDQGKGAPPYVCKLALSLYDEGVRDEQALTEYLTKEEKKAGFESSMRTLFGIGSRSLSASERRFFEEWQAAEHSEALIREAFDMAVASTGAARPAYINKMLLSWKEQQIRTPEEARAAAEAHRAKANYAGTGKQKKKTSAAARGESFSSFDSSEFFDAALRSSRSKYDGMSEEELLRIAKEE